MTINQCVLKLKAAQRCLLPQNTNNYSSINNTPRVINLNSPPQQQRQFAFWSKTSSCDKQEVILKECPTRACNAPKKGWFSWLFSSNKKDTPTKEIPDVRCCRKKYCRQMQNDPQPDLSEYGGQAYRTCGIAYVIQRDRLQPKRPCESKEDRILREMETPPDLKSRMIHDDPIKDSDNLFSRLVEMSDLGLHPLYKKIAATPLKEGPNTCKHIRPYQALTGPIDHSHLPAQIKINRSQLERKNLYWVHKNIAPPGDLKGRIMETKALPKHSTIGWYRCKDTKKSDVFDVDRCAYANVKRDVVFDSLKQKEMDFTGKCKNDDQYDRNEMVYNPNPVTGVSC